MKVNEVIGSTCLKNYLARVRCVVDGMGAATASIQIRCDGPSQARYLLSRVYGRNNVLSIQEITNDSITEAGGLIAPLTAQELQVKSLTDKSKKLNQQAKQTKALQSLQKAQNNYAKVSSAPVKSPSL